MIVFLLVALLLLPQVAPAQCCGDCNGDGEVAINELITAADEAVQGWTESSESELLGWWRMMDLDNNSWVLYDNGSIAAYAVGFVHGETFELDGFVHPARQGEGLGAWLVARAEERCQKKQGEDKHI